MPKTQNKTYGSIRKYKRYGTCGVILGMAAVTLAMNTGAAYADEVKPTAPATTEVAKTTEAPKANKTAKPVENKKVEETVKPVASPNLDSAVNKAKEVGITVTEKPSIEYATEAVAKADEAKQIEAIDKKIAEKEANNKEIAEAKKVNEESAAENKSKMEKAGLKYTGDFNKDSATVKEYNDKAKAENEANKKKYEADKATAEATRKENQATMESKGLKYTGDFKKDKAAVDAWNKENAGEKGESGLTATTNTTFEAVSGATKVESPKIAWQSIQGYNKETNTDANFDNVFLFDDKNGTAEIKVKGTSHGDVTLRFSGITPSPESGFVRSYVALWSAADGGIGYGVFISAGAGEANGGGGIDGQGGGSASGNYYDDRQGWIKNVNVEAITDANDVTDITINDIDNMQYVTVTGLDGAKLTMGANMSQNGNVFTASDNDKSDSTSGVLDSNGLGWTYEKGQKVSFSFDHTNTRDDSFSIVGGLFGRASIKKVKPIEIKEVKEPQFVTKQLVVLKKFVPVAREAVINVEYHKATVKEIPKTPETPTPKTPEKPTPTPKSQTPAKKVLPNTGAEVNVLGIVMSGITSVLGTIGLKRKKD